MTTHTFDDSSQKPDLEKPGEESPWTLTNPTHGDNTGPPGRVTIYTGGEFKSLLISYLSGKTGPSGNGPPPDVFMERAEGTDIRLFPNQPQYVNSKSLYLKTSHGWAVAWGTAVWLQAADAIESQARSASQAQRAP